MNKIESLNIPADFGQFLKEIERNYCNKLKAIDLFDKNKTAVWNAQQKAYFAAVFYHIRGHFISFMWYVANFTDDDLTKTIILENIKEEIGGEGRSSHEKLYEQFAKDCGIDIHDEIINHKHYLPFVKQFNKEHLRWLVEHEVTERLVAFAAYERLDNLDYHYLTKLAESLNLKEESLTFYRAHVQIEHFEPLLSRLIEAWTNSRKTVETAFTFIYSHQLQMWQNLSNAISNPTGFVPDNF